jgi:aryl-alcohol dehydrogenase-like predicted oxidoreductase
MTITRRKLLGMGAGAGAAATLRLNPLLAQEAPLVMKTIPKTGEMIPPIGIGTNRYGVGTAENERAPLRATLKLFAELGGKVIDTAAVYGTAETVIGDLVGELGIRSDLFFATKTDLRGQVSGLAGLQQRLERMQTEIMDLMQVHNLVDVANELAVMREWKQDGRIRYIGATISTANQSDDMARVMETEDMDFVQFNYSLDDRSAEARLLPLAAERRLAVLINLPFGRGDLFDKVEGRPLPDWAAEFDCASWGQFFLKYIISHPGVTAAIPGTRQERHVIDNLGAARGRLPDASLRKRQEEFFDSLS